MAKKAVVQLVAETKEHDKKIDNAAKKLNAFGKNGVGSLTSMMGAWGKLIPAVGAAVGAYDLFDKALSSNQALGDAWNNSIGAMKTTTDTFFEALTSGDWSAFNNGIDSLVAKAYDAKVALDQLGNSMMSLGVVNAKGNYELQQQMTILRGAKKGSEEYKAALEKANQIVDNMSAATGVVQSDQWKSIQTTVASWTGLNANDIQFDMVLNAQTLDSNENRDAIKAKAAADVKTYNEEMAKAQKQYGGMSWVDTYGNKHNSGGDTAALAERQKELNEQYKESIIINTLLAKKNDESLQDLDNLTQAYYGNAAAIETQRTMLARLGKETGGGGGGTGKPKKPTGPTQAEMDAAWIKNITSPEEMQNLVNEAVSRTPVTVPVVMEPIVEEWADDEDINAGLQEKLEMYNRIAEKIEYLQGLLAVANAQEAEGLKTQIEGLKKAQAGMGGLTTATKAAGTSGSEALGAMNSVLGTIGSNMDDTTGKVLQSVSSIIGAIVRMIPAQTAEAVASGTAKVASTSKSWYEIIPGIAAVVASIYSAINSTGFADGGIIGGISGATMGPDNTLAHVRTGEMVLNAQQQGNLFAMINNGIAGGGRGEKVQFEIRNDRLVGTLNSASNRNAYRY